MSAAHTQEARLEPLKGQSEGWLASHLVMRKLRIPDTISGTCSMQEARNRSFVFSWRGPP